MPNPLSGFVGAIGRAADRLAGPPPLVRAAAAGELSAVRVLVQKPIDLDQRDPKTQQTALHVAAEKCNELIVSELLDRRASSALQDGEGRTPLLIAAECGHIQIVQLLLGPRNKGPARPAALALRDARGYTPLLAAAARGHAAVVRALLAAGAPLGDALENRVSAGHLAAAGGHLEALSVLLQAGLNPRADTLDRTTLLHAAAAAGHAPVVSFLLTQGLDPNVRTLSTHATPLELAIQGGCFQAAMVLRDATVAPIAGPLAPPGAPLAPPIPTFGAGGGPTAAGPHTNPAGPGGFGFGYGAVPRGPAV